jgi:hypothetical protein
MKHEAGPVLDHRAPHEPTFLGSTTAPDEMQVLCRLHEIRATSRRRKKYATCAVAAGTLLAVALAQHTVSHVGPGAP